MPKKYTIREGFTFRGDDGKVAGGGDTIELADDVAKQHLHKLEPVEEPTKRKAAPKPAAAAESAPAVAADGSPEGADGAAADGE
jgi:hypothetical protein